MKVGARIYRNLFLLCFAVFVVVSFESKAQQENALQASEVPKIAIDLQEYIKKISISGSEKQAGEYLMNLCKEAGLHTYVFSDGDSAYNFAASIYPLELKKPNIILQSHIDVVEADDSLEWKHRPFSGNIDNNYIYGRGAIDAKGLSIMQLHALRQWVDSAKNKTLPFNITLLAVSGEETGGRNGSLLIVENCLRLLNPMVVLGEGGAGTTNIIPGKSEKQVFGISVAEKSNLWLRLDLKVKGKGHGANSLASNANKVMIRALNRLADLNPQMRFSKTNKRMFKYLGKEIGGLQGYVIQHLNWWFFRPFANIAFKQQPALEGFVRNSFTLTSVSNPPGPINKIPNNISAFLDCRILPNESKKAFVRELKLKLLEPRISFSIIDEGPSADESSPDTPFFKALSKSVQKSYPESLVLPILFTASTDNNYFREKGIPTYGLTPALISYNDLESVHGINERISIEGLQKGVEIYSDFITNLLQEQDLSVFRPVDLRSFHSGTNHTK